MFFVQSLVPTLVFVTPTIQSLKKPELIEAIRALGEEPPAKWGVTELRVRLQELEEEQGVIRQSGRVCTSLQEWTVKLNLVEFCQSELRTIPQLSWKAMDGIYQIAELDGQDPMSFGKYASLSYEEVRLTDPGESRLSKAVQNMSGRTDAAIRCSHWNGGDLGTQSGVDMILNVIDQHEPSHVWISTDCGPYPPLQAINQWSQAQIAQLAEKRRKVLQQYKGSSCVYQYCIQKGIHTTWELAQKRQGWRLPFIQHLLNSMDSGPV